MIAWMAYSVLVGAIVAAGGLAMEQLAAAMGRPRRIAWLAALALGVAIPVAGGWGSPAAAPVEEAAVAESEPAGRSVAGDLWRAVPAIPVPRDRAAGRIALLAWGAGSLAALVVLAGVLVVVARGRRRWERRRVLGADLYVSRRFGPALVGVARPRVVIPSWVTELEPGARGAVIRHELEHARAGDHLALLYGGLVAAAFPWSPAIWWMYRRLRAAVELDCDQRVLASGIGVADYGDVLLGAGSRSRGRWGFAPAMGQPRSLLERRLKTMSEKRRRLNAGRAALLGAVAVGAVAVACDTPVPTEVREAFEEAMADDAAQGADGERSDRVEVFLRAKAFGSGPEPMLFVDGVRIRAETDLPVSASDWFGGGIAEPDEIERVEVLKGPAAARLYGEEAAGGVIEVFTKGAEPELELQVEELVVTVPQEEPVAELQVEELVVTVPQEEPAAGLKAEELVATRQARVQLMRELKATELSRGLKAQELAVTAQARAQSLRELKVKATELLVTGSKPVVYVDGVRVDEAGLDKVLRDIVGSDRIDRIEVEKGELAEKLYGSEAAHGVIHIYTRR